MSNTIEYKGYKAAIEFDGEDEIFFGRVLGINEIIGFHGSDVPELKTAMRDMIDFYLDSCERAVK